MMDKIKLVIYRHKERHDVYLVRNFSIVGGNPNTDFYKATKSILEALESSNGLRGDEFERFFYSFADDDGNSRLIAKLEEQKQISVDGFVGVGTKTECFAVKDFEKIELTESDGRNTPQKPTNEATKPRDYTCPNCKNVIGDRFLDLSDGRKLRITENFCVFCGQEIDWKGIDDFVL